MRTAYRFLHGLYRRRYHGVYYHAKKLFVFDLLLLALALFMLGASAFFFLWKPSLAKQIDLQINLAKDERVKAGEPVELVINYRNRSKYELKDVSLAVHLPNGFVIDRERTTTSTFPSDAVVPLEKIKAGGKGSLAISGRFWIKPKTEQKILAVLTYKRPDLGNIEQKNAALLTVLPESVLTAKIAVDRNAFANSTLPLTITLTNSGDEPIRNIKLVTQWPQASNLDTAENLTVEPGQTKIINGQLTTPPQPGSYTFSVTPQLNIDHQTIQLETVAAPIDIFAPKIDLQAEWSGDLTYADSGSVIPLRISWRNLGSLTLKNLQLKINFSPTGLVDLKTTAQKNNSSYKDNDLIINKTARTALATARSQQGDEFVLNIYLKPTFGLTNQENVKLSANFTLTGESDEIGGKLTQNNVSQALPIATELTLQAQTRYYTPENDQLGRGPLPPQVGETTKYWIFLRIRNTSNAVVNPQFRATLAPGVSFTGKQSVTIGPSLDLSGNSVSWNYSQLPANSQTGLYFEVATTPSPEQVGQSPILLKNIKFSASDEWVKKDFTLTTPNLTTLLPNDDLGSKKGSAVVP